MHISVIRGNIERRLLVNYRVDPAALAKASLLPPRFRPQLVDGYAIAGICLIRLGSVRPPGVPAALGWTSENAAHRIAVEWEEAGATRCGVYVPRRDTSSHLNALLGGRAFPGPCGHARFTVCEEADRYRVSMESDDGATRVRFDGRMVPALPAGSVFGTLATASAFFERGALGYSPGREPDELEALELRCARWHVDALAVDDVASSLFDDLHLFPPDAARFDCALLMRDIDHEWHAGAPLSAGATTRLPLHV